MSIYKDMYLKLFNDVSEIIEELQKVQQECEQMYMETEPLPPIQLGNHGSDTCETCKNSTECCHSVSKMRNS